MNVLTALVEGYKAREGMKDRIRALNEWEIARRAGLTDVSYAEFFEHPSRDSVAQAVSCPVLTSPDSAVLRLRELL